MAKRKLSPEQLAALEELAQQWGKIIARSAYGNDGPALDTDFDEMEQIAAAATAGLVEGTLEHLTQQHAQRPQTSYPVPPAQSPAVSNANHAGLSHAELPSRFKNPSHTATPVDGTFSPPEAPLRLDSHGDSSSVLAKVVHAGATLPSFELAAKALRLLADVSISGRHVGRFTEAIHVLGYVRMC